MKAFFIVLPLLICLVWLAILTLDCALSRCGREQRVLAAYALVCSLLYGCHAWHFMGPHTAFGPVDVLYSFCTLACYVVYYLYIKSLTEKDGISWRDALWLLPAVLTSLLAAVLLLLGKDTSAVPLVTKILTPLEIIPVAWFGLRRLQRFDRRVEGFYSDPENHSTRPVRILMLVFLSLALLAFVANVIGRDYFSCSMRIAIPSLLFGSLQFAILYVGSRQPSSAEEMTAETQDAEEGPGDADTFGERIRRLMVENRLYRQKGLKITDVAAAVGSNRTYVSQWFNRECGQTFSDYINTWRIEEAKSLLLAAEAAPSLSEIAEEAGFSSESAFFRNFYARTGLSPLAWLKEHR